MAIGVPRTARTLTFELGHTCMNHFVLLDCRQGEPQDEEALKNLARTLCASSLSDDMLVLQGSARADARLRIFGGDGREGDFCGNGTIYAAARVGLDLGRSEVTIETACGTKSAVDLGHAWKVELGTVTPLERELAAIGPDRLRDQPVYGLLRAGEPHLVMFRPNEIRSFHVPVGDFEAFCAPLRDISGVAGGISITMIFDMEFRSILIRTYERGARRHTFSCGTGSVAAVAAVFGVPEDDTAFHVCSPGGGHAVTYERGTWHLAASPQRIGVGRLDDEGIHLPLNGLLPYRSGAGGPCR